MATPKQIALLDRRRMALELRIQGGSYTQIAEAMRKQPGVSAKYNASLAFKDIQDALEELHKRTADLAQQHVTLELERMDALIAILWPKAERGDYFAIDKIMQLSQQRLKLLGLVTPAPITVLSGNVAIGGTQQNLTQNTYHTLESDDLDSTIQQLTTSIAALAAVGSSVDPEH